MSNQSQIKSELLSLAIDNEVKQPKDYTVILVNDDVTPMDFVEHVLVKFYDKTIAEAQTLTLKAHTKGFAVIGCYSYDIARTKVQQTKIEAQTYGFPLKCDIRT